MRSVPRVTSVRWKLRGKQALVVAATAVALTACGGQGGPHPGVGVEVAGEQVSDDEVDSLTTDYCTAVVEVNGDQMVTVPLRDLRATVVHGLTLDLAIDEFLSSHADDPAVDPEAVQSAYADQVGQLHTTLKDVDQDVADSVIRVEGAALRLKGLDSTGAGDAFQNWFADQDVVVDPAYGVAVEDGKLSAESPLSAPVSDLAVLGKDSLGGGQSSAEYAGSLPVGQTCGPQS